MVLSSSRDTTVRRRRTLYEAILQLERGGATVLEQELCSLDAALSASTCLCLCTEASLQASSLYSQTPFSGACQSGPRLKLKSCVS